MLLLFCSRLAFVLAAVVFGGVAVAVIVVVAAVVVVAFVFDGDGSGGVITDVV